MALEAQMSLPTGNFGNILAAYYAGEMGIPVNKFICASNENNVLTDFINTGVYDLGREFIHTSSPSMDILISSNLERLLYHVAGNDGDKVKELMEALGTEKKYEIDEKMKEGMARFVGGFANVDQVSDAIGKLFREDGYLIDTHTAVGYCVYADYREKTGDKTPTLLASTASAYKFAESVAKALGLPEEKDGFAYIEAVAKATGVPVPYGLKDLENKPVLHDRVVTVPEMPQAVLDALK